MKFPKSLFDKDAYLKHLNILLMDDETQLFLDTNILALFFKMNISARMEFYAWIDKMIFKNKVKIPTWVVNEYTNRFIRKKTSDYLDGISKFSTIQKEFTSLVNYLKLHVDDSRLSATKYNNTEDLFTDLDEMQECLKKISSIANTKMSDYIIEAHDELVARFEKVNINSDIFTLVEEIVPNGKSRYLQELPPGFEDDKDFNSFGDLIIWNEILRYSATNNHKKVIIITNDNKKDWMYAPLKVIENGHTKNNPNFKIADPRLVFEFSKYTESEELYIINFETLIKLLISGDDGSEYFKLAKALQLIHDLDKNENPSNSEVNMENISDVDDSIDVIAIPQEGNDVEENGYSEFAIVDSTPYNHINSDLTKIIVGLKTYNWYSQNDAIEVFSSLDFVDFENNQENKDFFFIIGRNIYQSACGGAFKAVEFIDYLEKSLERLGETSIHVLNGMLYEIYFNSSGTLRNKYKNTFYQKIFELSKIERYQLSFEFINNELEKIGNAIFIIPTRNSSVRVITVKSSIIDGTRQNANSIVLDDLELLEADELEGLTMLGNIRGVENYILNRYAFPIELVTFEFEPNPENRLFTIDSMKFKSRK